MSEDKSQTPSKVTIPNHPVAEELAKQLPVEWTKYPCTPMTSSLHGKKRFLRDTTDITNKKIRVYEYAKEKGQILIDINENIKEQIKEFKSSTTKTLNYIMQQLIDQNPAIKDKNMTQDMSQTNFPVRFKVRDFQKIRGINSYKEMRKQVKRDSDLLYRTSLKYSAHIFDGKKRKIGTIETRILTDKIEIRNGDVILFVNGNFVQALRKQGIFWVSMPDYYYRAKPIPSQILFKLCDHANTNQESDKKRRFSILSVAALLEAVGSIPSHENVIKGKNRKVRERIIVPLTNGLDECQSKNLWTWEFCNAKGKPFTPEQVEGLNRNGNPVDIKSKKDKYYLKWDNFKKLYIRYNLKKPFESTPPLPLLLHNQTTQL